jgi:hypothetical protein
MRRASVAGVVTPAARTLYHSFNATVAGAVTVTAAPAAPWTGVWGSSGQGNLNVRLELLRASDLVVVAANDSDAALDASITLDVNASSVGGYVIALSGAGSAASGYPAYGSVGGYTLTAAVPSAAVKPPRARRPRKAPAPPPSYATPLALAGTLGVARSFQPKIVIVPGVTLCNVETRVWYAWLRNALAGPPTFATVVLQ